MTYCPNYSDPKFKEIIAALGGDPVTATQYYYNYNGDLDTLYEDIVSKVSDVSAIKPGVSELFESNLELANAVYEALGFNENLETKLDELGLGFLLDSTKEQYSIDKNKKHRLIKIKENTGEIDETKQVASYDPVTNTIILSKIATLKEIIHELIHHVLHREAVYFGDNLNIQGTRNKDQKYIDKGKVAGKKLKEYLLNNVKKYFGTEISKLLDYNENSRSYFEELLTYYLTSKKFREELESLPDDIKNEILEIINELLENHFTKEQIELIKEQSENLLNNQITPQQKQQAQQLYSQYLDTIFPDSKVEEMDNNLYISVLNQLEQENKIEKDCSGGKLKAKDGISTLFEKGGKWEVITDFKNAPTHKSGGKNISIEGKKVEVEKNELKIENDFGDVAVIPSKYRIEVQDAIKSNCHSCIDDIVESLPKMKDYAGDGTVFPFFGRYKRFKNSLPDNLKNTPESDYAMRYYWKHGNKPKSFDEAINRENPMFTMEDDGFYHAPSVEPNTLRFLKPKNHPTLQYELDWYNSDNPDAIDFRSKYDLDTSGKFYRYILKKQ